MSGAKLHLFDEEEKKRFAYNADSPIPNPIYRTALFNSAAALDFD